MRQGPSLGALCSLAGSWATDSFLSRSISAHRLLFLVSAELLAQRREHAIGEAGLSLRLEAAEERRGQDGRRDPLLDGGDRRPASLPRVGDAAGEARKIGIAGEGAGRQV